MGGGNRTKGREIDEDIGTISRWHCINQTRNQILDISISQDGETTINSFKNSTSSLNFNGSNSEEVSVHS